MKLETFDASDATQVEQAVKKIATAIADAEAVAAEEKAGSIIEAPIPEVVKNDDLIGIADDVYEQINAALKSGKRHLMFYGPPGTGKTQLAIDIASQLADDHALVTGSSDWTSQDLIGGYSPVKDGFAFVPGVLLTNFDKPFIIDELNRCDIDKVLGPLFTVLAGAPSTLPYLTDPANKNSLRYTILPKYNPLEQDHEFSPTPYWRILATINSIDKASLYQMSYALTRRFAWILVDVPVDLAGFIVEYCGRKKYGPPPGAGAAPPLAAVWRAINAERKIGPAPFIELIAFCRSWKSDFDFFGIADQEGRRTYVSGLSAFIFPMLDGITRVQASRIYQGIFEALLMAQDQAIAADLESRLAEMAI